MRRLIAVVGPHRTGTSATTKGIADLGASLGDGPLMPGDEHEYFENMALAKALHGFFAAFGGTWDQPVLPPKWDRSEVAGLARKKIGQILAEDYPEDRTYVLKSPLMCLLRPLFEGVDLTVVKTFRSQWETMESLQRAFKKADPIWALRTSELYLKGQASWAGDWKVDFRDLWDWRKVAKLAAFLKFPFRHEVVLDDDSQIHFGPRVDF